MGEFLGAFISMIGQILNSVSVSQTNQTNYAMNRETNQQQMQLAELGYQRSLPTSQVRNLQNAGMSKAAALSALSGGGSYTAPVLNTAQMQPQHVDLNSVAERIANIPSNTNQLELQRLQAQSLRDSIVAARNEEKRKQDEHAFNQWNRMYSKETATALDNAENLYVQKLLDSGKDFSDFKSIEHSLRSLGLSDSPIFRSMPSSARGTFEEHVRSKFNEERERRRSDDLHALNEQQLTDLRDRAQDYHNEKNARIKEYKLRALRAHIDTILADDGLSIYDYQHSLEFNKDGSVRWTRKMSERFKRAWDRLADTVGISVLKDLVSGIVTIAK